MTRRPAGALTVFLGLAVLPHSVADDWPQWRGPARDGVWRENGILDRFPDDGLPSRWRAPVGPGFSGPAVSAGRVVVLDLEPADPGADVSVAWNARNATAGRERVLCLDAATGKTLWMHAYPCAYDVAYGTGPRSTPTIHGNRVYALGAMGDLACLDAETGRVAWKTSLPRDLKAEVPLYGFSSPPLVDGDRVIVTAGGPGQTVVAFDRHSGAVAWRTLSASEPGYAPPMLFTLAGRRQGIVFHADGLSGLDPESGRELWSVPMPTRAGVAIVEPAREGDRLAVSSQYGGSSVLSFSPDAPQPEILWHVRASEGPEKTWRKAGFNTTMSTVLLRGGHVYGVSLYGELCCLNGETGARVWTTLQPTTGAGLPRERWCTAFLVPNGGHVFIFNERGELIRSRLSPAGYEEVDRVRVIEPDMPSGANRKVVWSHPAFANRCVYARNNRELVCVSLATPDGR